MGELPTEAAGQTGFRGVPPIWLGDDGSVVERVIERLCARSGLLDDAGRYAHTTAGPAAV
ncbi:hypothetical protein [Streptomyces sp. NPDC058872]|uniref:hypothetical protein n=1 Tax=Streptomyces sp. NPDC058872 TaxID=3346661 RepID=UPI00368A9E66